MGLRINTNVAAINAQRNLAKVTGRLNNNYQRLATGLRISTAADDAAGLAISERMKAQIRSIDQAKRNANDGISLSQTAEGALDEVSSILVRLRELAIQASNGTVSDNDKATLEEEFSTLKSEIDRIASSTEFNGIKLLDGTATQVSFHIGSGNAVGTNQITVALSDINIAQLSISSASIGTSGNTSTAIADIDTTINTISSLRGKFGATQNRLLSTVNNLAVASENINAANSRIRDVDVAFETADLTRNSILQQASLSILAQANAQPQSALSLLG
ncbi:MAG: flagellin FliC [Planctomycetes bacterium]|nr:flagellin FliC [Planctomycetota bacterium]MCB9887949.1 flagellin FliC [Planctomycetota bacterium]